MRRKPRQQPPPRDPPDDEPGPQLLTARRASNQVAAMHLDLCRTLCRLEALTRYTDSPAVRDVLGMLEVVVKDLRAVSARLLSGEIPITRGEDAESWQRRQPLIAAIEAANGNGHHEPEPAGRPPRRCGQCGTIYDPARGRRTCPSCGASINQQDATRAPEPADLDIYGPPGPREQPPAGHLIVGIAAIPITGPMVEDPEPATKRPRRPRKRLGESTSAAESSETAGVS